MNRLKEKLITNILSDKTKSFEPSGNDNVYKCTGWCTGCKIKSQCRKVFGGSVARLSAREMSEYEYNNPEYFI